MQANLNLLEFLLNLNLNNKSKFLNFLLNTLNRSEQSKEECKRHLQNSLEMAKNRYNKREPSDISMIEIVENGVTKKILVPMAAITTKSRKRPAVHINQKKTKISTPILPKKQISSASVLPSHQKNGTNSSENALGDNVLTVRQINQSLPICTSIVTACMGLPQTNCLPSTNSFIQPYQTLLINHAPGPVLTTPFTQQPLVYGSKAINPNIGSTFVLQSNSNPIQSVIQLPTQTPQIQLIGSHQTVFGSQVNSINQSQFYLNQPSLQNSVFITPQAKPFVFTQANQMCPQQIKSATLNNNNILNIQPQEIIINSSANVQGLSLTNSNNKNPKDKADLQSRKDKNAWTSKVMKILPKSVQIQTTPKEPPPKDLSPDKQNLINKLTLAAERSSTVPFIFTLNDDQSSVTLNSRLLDETSPVNASKEVHAVTDKIGRNRKYNNFSHFRPIQSSAKVKPSKGTEQKGEIKNSVNALKTGKSVSNVTALMLKSKLNTKLTSRSDDVAKLGNQVPTVVLNPISIPPGVMTTKVANLKASDKNSIKHCKLKKMSSFRSIQPKPSVSSDSAVHFTGQMEMQPHLSENRESGRAVDSTKQANCSKFGNDSVSDRTIAQLLHKYGSWVDDDDDDDDEEEEEEDDNDDFKEEHETEIKKKRSGKLVDKSYKCYLGRAADSSKYPRTRSFFKSKHYN